MVVQALDATAEKAMPDAEDLADKQKKIEITKARRACAALILDAFGVAKAHTDAEFQDRFDHELKAGGGEAAGAHVCKCFVAMMLFFVF